MEKSLRRVKRNKKKFKRCLFRSMSIPRPQTWWDSSDGRQPESEQVVEDVVVKGENVFELGVTDAATGRCNVAQGTTYEHLVRGG